MKKYAAVIISFTVLTLANCMAIRPDGITDCRFYLTDAYADVNKVGLFYGDMVFEMNVFNPNSVDIAIEKMDLDFYVKGIHVGSKLTKLNKEIQAGDGIVIKPAVSVDLFRLIFSHMRLDKYHFTLKAKVYYKTPYGNYSSRTTIFLFQDKDFD